MLMKTGKFLIVFVLLMMLVNLSGCKAERYKLDSSAIDGKFEMEDPTLMQKLQERADESTFRIVINSNPFVDMTTKRSNLMIANPEENKSKIRVDIYLEETGKYIYQSRIVLPGERIAYDYLQEELAAGEHNAIAVFSTLDDKTEEVANQFEVAVLLEVQEEESYSQ